MLGTSNELNSKSLIMVKTVYNNFRVHPSYSGYTITIDNNDIQGSASITIYRDGLNINKFYFYPNSVNGDIESIAIYGNQLNGHFNSINSSKIAFGLRIIDIELVTQNTMSPFVDVNLQPY